MYFLDIGTTGEVLLIHNISRFCGGIYECEAQNGTFFMILLFVLSDIGTTGEVLLIHNISRFCGGIYECEAQNGIGIGARRAINVDVECKYLNYTRVRNYNASLKLRKTLVK